MKGADLVAASAQVQHARSWCPARHVCSLALLAPKPFPTGPVTRPTKPVRSHLSRRDPLARESSRRSLRRPARWSRDVRGRRLPVQRTTGACPSGRLPSPSWERQPDGSTTVFDRSRLPLREKSKNVASGAAQGSGSTARPRVVDSLETKPGSDWRDVDDCIKVEVERAMWPDNEAWLPVMETEREKWDFTLLYSNTKRAHDLDKTHDWVVITTRVTARKTSARSSRRLRARWKESASYGAARRHVGSTTNPSDRGRAPALRRPAARHAARPLHRERSGAADSPSPIAAHAPSPPGRRGVRGGRRVS